MTITILSKLELQRLIENKKLTPKVAIVSFADSKDEFLDFPEDISVFKVVFEDIRPFCTVPEHYDKFLPEANQIAAYVHQKIKENKNIICQCEFGISRSAGLAAAILERYAHKGVEVFANYRYSPNQFVFNKVYRELRKL